MHHLSSTHFWILVYLLRIFLGLSLVSQAYASPSRGETPSIDSSSPKSLLTEGTPPPASPDNILKKEAIGLGFPLNSNGTRRIDPLTTEDLFSKVVYLPPRGGLHFGYLSGNTTNAESSDQTYSLGLVLYFKGKVEFSKTPSPQKDLELNLQSNSRLNVGLSQIWQLDYEEAMKPYFKLGLFNHIDSSDLLAGLINLRHFKLRVGLGLSDFLDKNNTYYLEMGLGWGQTGLAGDLRLGHTFRY